MEVGGEGETQLITPGTYIAVIPGDTTYIAVIPGDTTYHST